MTCVDEVSLLVYSYKMLNQRLNSLGITFTCLKIGMVRSDTDCDKYL